MAKLSPPRLHGPVLRERLFEEFDRLRAYPCIWLSGPPGAGKTTLTASYLDDRGVAAYWYQCDRGDADASTFFHYLGLAFNAYQPQARQLLALAPEHVSQLAAFSRRYFQQLFERLPDGAVLVLDNWHETESEALGTVLEEAIRQVPLRHTLVVVSRHDPPSAMAGVIATRLLTCFPSVELLFNLDETRALAAGHDVRSERQVEQLHSRSRGWAAGLILMIDSLRRTGEAGSGEPATEHLFDYFATQVLESTSPLQQRTLMLTALPPRVGAAFAQQLSGDAQAAELLEALFQRQMFTYRTLEPEPTYHFHALFREFLLSRARQDFGPRYGEVAGHAAKLTAERGQIEDAFDLACEAGDFAFAERLLLAHAPIFLGQGRWQALTSAIDRIPVAVVQAQPWLRYWKGVALAATSTSAAKTVLEDACLAFEAVGDLEGAALATAELLECFMRAWALNQEMDHWIARMERVIERGADLRATTRAACFASMVSALLHRQPSHPLLPACAEGLELLLPFIESPDRQLSMAVCLVQYFDCVGQHVRAESIRSTTQGHAGLAQLRPLSRFSWWARMSEHFVFVGDRARARSALEEALAIVETNGLHDQECFAVGTLCQICIDAGNYGDADRLVERVRDTLVPRYRVYAAMLYWLQLWLNVSRGDRAAAARVWPELERIPAAGVAIHAPFNHPVVVHLSDTGEYAAALDRIGRWRAGLAGMRSPRMDYELDLMEAYVRLTAHEMERGLTLLQRALGAARTHHFLSTHAWVPRMMGFLLARALDHGIETEYVHAWIRRREIAPPDADAPFWPRPLTLITLGRFAILREGEPVVFSRKAPRKVIQMLKALVALRGDATTHYIQDLLWPELEGDAQHEAFGINLHRLRRLLGRSDIIKLQDGRLTLERSLCWIDALAFEGTLDRLGAENGVVAGEALLQQVLALYRGAFLSQDTQEPWSVSMRERLRSKFVRVLLKEGRRLEELSLHDAAITLYRRGIESDDLVEEFYQGLMRCCVATQRVGEGAAIYRKLEQNFAAALGVTPSGHTRALGEQLLRLA